MRCGTWRVTGKPELMQRERVSPTRPRSPLGGSFTKSVMGNALVATELSIDWPETGIWDMTD
jgi:hypothetical protein